MKLEKVCCHCAAGVIICEAKKKSGKVLCANGHVIPRTSLITAKEGDRLLPSWLRRFTRKRKAV